MELVRMQEYIPLSDSVAFSTVICEYVAFVTTLMSGSVMLTALPSCIHMTAGVGIPSNVQ